MPVSAALRAACLALLCAGSAHAEAPALTAAAYLTLRNGDGRPEARWRSARACGRSALKPGRARA